MEQLSLIFNPTKLATFVTAAGATPLQASTVNGANVPEITGGVVSLTVIVCVQVAVFKIVFSPESLNRLLFVSAYSVTVYVRVTTCGQVFVFALLAAVI